MQTQVFNIPFSGFYESGHSNELEHETGNLFTNPESGEIEGDAVESLWEGFYLPWEARESYAKLYAAALLAYCESAMPAHKFAKYAEFVRLWSPREYNFSTDRIDLSLPQAIFSGIFKRTDKEILARLLVDQLTSRDGFNSFYHNDSARHIEDFKTQFAAGNTVDPALAGIIFEAFVYTCAINSYDCLPRPTAKSEGIDLLIDLDRLQDFLEYDLLESNRGNGAISGIVWESLDYVSEKVQRKIKAIPRYYRIKNAMGES